MNSSRVILASAIFSIASPRALETGTIAAKVNAPRNSRLKILWGPILQKLESFAFFFNVIIIVLRQKNLSGINEFFILSDSLAKQKHLRFQGLLSEDSNDKETTITE